MIHKKILLGFIALFLYVMCITNINASLNDGLISYYSFDNNAEDLVGSNNGIVYNASATEDGIINGAYSFDGSGDYISYGNNSSLNNDSMSYSFWVKSSSDINPNDAKGLLTKAPNTGYNNELWIRFTTEGYIVASACDGSSSCVVIIPETDYYDGQFHHIVLIKEYNITGDTLYLYIDGEFVGSNSFAHNIIQDTANMENGRSSSKSFASRYFNGIIDEQGFWNRALTNTEVSKLYNSGNGLQYPFHNYCFNELTDVNGIEIESEEICNANLWDVNIINSTITDSNITSAYLEDSNIYSPIGLLNNDYNNVTIFDANLEDINILGVTFENSLLENSQLLSTIIKDSNVYNSDINFNDLNGLNIYNSNIIDSNIYNSNIFDSNIYNGYFSGINIIGDSLVYVNDSLCYNGLDVNWLQDIVLNEEISFYIDFGLLCEYDYNFEYYLKNEDLNMELVNWGIYDVDKYVIDGSFVLADMSYNIRAKLGNNYFYNNLNGFTRYSNLDKNISVNIYSNIYHKDIELYSISIYDLNGDLKTNIYLEDSFLASDLFSETYSDDNFRIVVQDLENLHRDYNEIHYISVLADSLDINMDGFNVRIGFDQNSSGTISYRSNNLFKSFTNLEFVTINSSIDDLVIIELNNGQLYETLVNTESIEDINIIVMDKLDTDVFIEVTDLVGTILNEATIVFKESNGDLNYCSENDCYYETVQQIVTQIDGINKVWFDSDKRYYYEVIKKGYITKNGFFNPNDFLSDERNLVIRMNPQPNEFTKDYMFWCNFPSSYTDMTWVTRGNLEQVSVKCYYTNQNSGYIYFKLYENNILKNVFNIENTRTYIKQFELTNDNNYEIQLFINNVYIESIEITKDNKLRERPIFSISDLVEDNRELLLWIVTIVSIFVAMLIGYYTEYGAYAFYIEMIIFGLWLGPIMFAIGLLGFIPLFAENIKSIFDK